MSRKCGTVTTAFHLKSKFPLKSVLLLDKYSAPGQGNTIKSNSAYRNIFDTNLNILLSGTSIEFYKFLEMEKNINLELQETGYLWLLDEDQYQSRNEKRINVMINKKNRKLSFLEFLKFICKLNLKF